MTKNNKIKLWKKLITIFIGMIFGLGIIGCSISICNDNVYSKNNPPKIAQFKVIYVNYIDHYKVIYHKKTKVMYSVSIGSYNQGVLTRLDNVDGNPLLYEE